MHLLAGKARHRLIGVLVSVGHVFRNPALDATAGSGAAEQDCGHRNSIDQPAAWAQCSQRPVMTCDGLRRSLAAKTVTTTIPIVFSTPGDPTELGLVASYNRPGGNITGVSFTTAAEPRQSDHEGVDERGPALVVPPSRT